MEQTVCHWCIRFREQSKFFRSNKRLKNTAHIQLLSYIATCKIWRSRCLVLSSNYRKSDYVVGWKRWEYEKRLRFSTTKSVLLAVVVVPRAVQRALDSDDDLDTLADPCGNSEFGDEITAAYFPPPPRPPLLTTSTAATTTAAATTTTEFSYYWRNRNYHGPSPDDHIMYPWGVPTTRVDSVWPPALPTAAVPRQLNYNRLYSP